VVVARARLRPVVRIGISGWTYAPWRGVFYPLKLKHKDELSFASRKFPSIEINGSFYSLMRPESYDAWYRAVPDDFVFAVKGGRFITHMKRLKDVRSALANFFASGLLLLKEKLGPILWQLPPSLRFDEGTLGNFLELLPKTTTELGKLAEQHDQRLNGRSAVEPRTKALTVRHVLEVRHESFEDSRFFRLLREHQVACCVADSAGRYPLLDETTANFSYARLHGKERLYVSGYEEEDLRHWAKRVRRWQKRGDVFVYFDNDVKVRAPFDAQNLARVLAGEPLVDLPGNIASVTEEPRTGWAEWQRTAGRRAS